MQRWLRSLAMVVVAVVTITGCGSGGDGSSATAGSRPDAAAAGDGTSTADADPPEDEAFMPDLLGLTEDEARQELGDLGVDDGVRVTERESLEDAGTVIEQVPSSGQRITGDVDLIVAKPVGPVPDFVGQKLSDVEEWAAERGIEVRTEEVLDDTLADGEVVETTPAADDDATSEILVQVSRIPTIGQLSEFEQVGECRPETGEVGVNGETYPNSLYVRLYSGDCTAEYNLGRDWERFKATVGLSDNSPANEQIRFEVVADGTTLFNEVLGLGTAKEVDVDVSGVLRLALRITLVSDGDAYTYGVWGNARLIGSPDAVGEDGDSGPTTTEG